MLRLAIAGFGAIGSQLLERLAGLPHLRVDTVLVPPRSLDAARERLQALYPRARAVSRLQDAPSVPQLLVECAGHSAVDEHVLPALARGIPCVVASVGAFANAQRALHVEAAARAGHTRVQLVAGAIGAIDALAAARLGGLASVVYTGRKPPAGWRGSPAEHQLDLDALPPITPERLAERVLAVDPDPQWRERILRGMTLVALLDGEPTPQRQQLLDDAAAALAVDAAPVLPAVRPALSPRRRAVRPGAGRQRAGRPHREDRLEGA